MLKTDSPPPHPVCRSYIFALWDGVQKVASAVHAQISSCNSQAKLIVRSVVKWHEFCRNKTIVTTLICYARLMQCSKPVKNRKKPVFFKLSVQISWRIWMVVRTGYFSHANSHSKNVASACRVPPPPPNKEKLCLEMHERQKSCLITSSWQKKYALSAENLFFSHSHVN